MDKQEWKSFFRFIDEGSEAELQQRKDAQEHFAVIFVFAPC